MVNYANSVVYKIMSLDPEIDDIYVGSTTAFRKRKHEHKSDCNNDNSKRHNRYVYKFIRNNGGWDNWSMVVIKAYPTITNKMELLTKETKWLKKLNATLNQHVPGAVLELGTAEYKKQYYIDNKDKISEQQKQYYIDNKDKINEYNKQYYIANQAQLKAHHLEKIECECGCKLSRIAIYAHRKTKKHIQLMNQ